MGVLKAILSTTSKVKEMKKNGKLNIHSASDLNRYAQDSEHHPWGISEYSSLSSSNDKRLPWND